MKEQKQIFIRKARLEDDGKLLESYRPYVEKTDIAFEF